LEAYPNFVYSSIFEKIDDPIRISSNVNELDEILALEILNDAVKDEGWRNSS
jgi:hypothetical protein